MNVKKLFNAKMDRRRMLGNLGLMGAGAALTACSTVIANPPEQEDYDAAILNFALNLEYLEAAFYLAAIGRLAELPGYSANKIILPEGYNGTDPSQSLFPAMGPVDSGNYGGNLSVAEYAQEIANDELAHVEFLRTALDGAGAPVADLPTLDLDASFRAAASVAFGLVSGYTPPFGADDFQPLMSFDAAETAFGAGIFAEAFFVHGAYIFEDVGVTAYKGAARFITNKDYLEAAAGILAAEAYHAGEIRAFLYSADMRRNDLYGGLDTWTIARAISDARDSLDGSSDLDQGIVGNAGLNAAVHEGPDGVGANIVPSDMNGIVFSRTPRQVANIVFLNPDNDNLAGGFFPEGISVPAGLEDDFAYLLSL